MPQPHFAPPNFRLDSETREALLRRVVPVAGGASSLWIERRPAAKPQEGEKTSQGTETPTSGSEG